jgi:hypothetical protein
MDQLGRRRIPMERLAFGLAIVIGVVALAAWGLVTFVAGRFAIVSAARVTRT